MNILSAQAMRGKPSDNEQVLQAALLVAACVFPGLPAVVLGAYISMWTRLPHEGRELVGLGVVTVVCGAFGLVLLPWAWEAFFEALHQAFNFDVKSAFTAIGFLWLVGLPFAPLVGVVMSFWRELWAEVSGAMRNVNETTRRGLHQAEQQELSVSKHAAHKAEQIADAGRPGELLLGAVVPGSTSGSLPDELGIFLGGSKVALADWVQNTHMLVIGASGEGKTETLLRLIHENIKYTNRRVILIDGKGDPALAERFRSVVWSLTKQEPKIFRLGYPEAGASYNGFMGTSSAIFNRLCAMVGVESADVEGGQDFYKRLNALLLWLMCKAPGGAPRNFAEVERRLDLAVLEELWVGNKPKLEAIAEIRKQPQNFAGLRHMLRTLVWEFEDQISDQGFALDDTRYALFSLKTGSAGFTANLLLKFLVEDLKDYLCNRQEEPTTVIIDEFSAFGNRNIVTILTQGRSAELGVILATQGIPGLGDKETREEIIEYTRTKILMSIERPEEIASLAGTVKALEIGQQVEEGAATGVGTVREQDQFAIDMNQAARLPRGQAYVIRKRRKVRVNISRVGMYEKVPEQRSDNTLPPNQDDAERPADGAEPDLRPW